MDTPDIVFREVTGDPEAEEKARREPDWRPQLLALGFAPAGLVEARAGGDQATAEMLKTMATTPDAQRILTVAQEGEVVEILVSPDRSAQAVQENAFDGAVVCFRTLAESGEVVETTMRPARDPEIPVLPGMPAEASGGAGSVPLLLTLKIVQAIAGASPLWPRQNRPRAGFHVELVKIRDVEELWERHRSRLRTTLRQEDAPCRFHNTVRVEVALVLRNMQIMRHVARWQRRIDWVEIILFL
ncbi:MAG TPA: hypothetical protein VLC95_12830, partial [Anaerolineae bacterium]|nr:hypothetical protein [Anaerolineae bacterium]